MTARRRATGEPATGTRGGFGVIGVGLAMALCCAVPALLAGGALATLAGVVGDPFVILTVVALAAGAVGWRLPRRPGGRGRLPLSGGHGDAVSERTRTHDESE